MDRRHIAIGFLVLLLSTSLCRADEIESHFADSLVVQYAGFLGLVSAGVEHVRGSHSDFHLLAGYSPASVAGVDIYALGVKANYRFAPLLTNEHATVRLHTGVGLFYYFGDQYDTRDYPDGYYTPPASEWHVMPYLGMRLTSNNPEYRHITLYAEAGILDAHLIHYYNNYQTLGLEDVISISLGISLPLH